MDIVNMPTSCQEAIAAEVFERFSAAGTMKQILSHFREICDVTKLKSNHIGNFYPLLKAKLHKSWRAQAIFRKLDSRYFAKIYYQGKVCPNTRVLIIGAGPCGLRSAIDAQLLGAKVVVIEKRDRMTRNNVLHLWPFVIEDLRGLGAKKFLGKFCAGAIDHISIRQLQHILLKVALLLGVEFHEGVGFEGLVEPEEGEKCGWRASVSPSDHPVSQYEFDVLIGADGKRNTLSGFKRKEFRGKLAIAITANFVNRHSKEEASVEEISGTAFIYNQEFFLNLRSSYKIDLENIVYYKDDTHYFVMTAKKQSLLERNVLLKDYPETVKLLSRENINYAALRKYALDAANYATDCKLPNLEFAVNHYGQPDVAVFDFTSMFAAENASKVLEKKGHKLLVCLVGDSLLEPFWPTGSGCARGFLSSLDACWAIKSWSMGLHPLAVLAERESIYRILAQTTPQNLNLDLVHYTVDPSTRYVALNKYAVSPHQVVNFYTTDNPKAKENINSIELGPQPGIKKRKRDTLVTQDILLSWFKRQVTQFPSLRVDNLTTSFKDGVVLCSVLYRYRPDLINFGAIDPNNKLENNEAAFQLLNRLGIMPIMTAQEMMDSETPDPQAMVMYLSQVYNLFRGEIPATKHIYLDSPEPEKNGNSTKSPLVMDASFASKIVSSGGVIRSNMESESRKKPRRRSGNSSKYQSASVEQRKQKMENMIYNNANNKKSKKLLKKLSQNSHLIKSIHMLQTNSREDPQQLERAKLHEEIEAYRESTLDIQDRIQQLENLLKNPDMREKSAGHGMILPLNENFNKDLLSDDQSRPNAVAANKKPKDLLRSIGKIEKSDWNFHAIEKKILENRKTKLLPHDKEKVPRWNREQFLVRQRRILEHSGEQGERPPDAKFMDIDNSLRQLDQQLKEGNVLEVGQRGRNKVASLAGQFADKNDKQEAAASEKPKPAPKFNIGVKTELCRVCKKNVYLMEKISPEESLILHKSCFKCYFCSTTLKIGSYTFDREGKYGNNIFCPQHFGVMGKIVKQSKSSRNKSERDGAAAPHPVPAPGTIVPSAPDAPSQFQLLDRDQTPERIEIESQTDPLEEFNEMDEDEWTDRNFGNSLVLDDGASGDDESSSSEDEAMNDAIDDDKDDSESGSDSEGSEMDSADYESDSGDQFSCHEYSSGDEEGGSCTWGSEQQIALERRRQEVALQAPPPSTTPTDTEVASESSSKNSEAANSATEVSTDSEFAHDDPTPTCEVPFILFNDHEETPNYEEYSRLVEKHKPPSNIKKATNDLAKVQVTSKFIINGNVTKKPEADGNIKLEFNSILPTPKLPLLTPRPGDYLLNRTHSTSAITKRALELKKKYLLGPQAMTGLQKSDSASQLDSKFRAFHSNISECQKLLNPAPDISPSMQAFLENSSRRNVGGLLSPTNTTPATKLPQVPTQPFVSAIINSDESNKIKTESSENKLEKNQTSNAPMPDIVQTTSIKSNIILSPNNIFDSNPKAVEANPPISEENIDTQVSPKPVFETSIVVPKLPWKNVKKNYDPSGTEIDSDSLVSLESSSEDISGKNNTQSNISVPRVEIMKPCGEVMQLDSLMIVNGEYIGPQESDDDIVVNPKSPTQSSFSPNSDLQTITSEKSNNLLNESKFTPAQTISSSDSGNDITAFFTDNEPLDWAVEGAVSDNLGMKSRALNSKHPDNSWKQITLDSFAESEHVCGKESFKDPKRISNILLCDHSDIDFMDTGSEDSFIDNNDDGDKDPLNTGFIEFVDVNTSANQKTATPKSVVIEAVNHHCEERSPVNDRSINFIEQGACILENRYYNDYSDICDDKPLTKIDSTSNPKLCTSISYSEEDDELFNVKVAPKDTNESDVLKNSVENIKLSTPTNSSFEISDSKETPKKPCNSPATSRKLQEISDEKKKQKDLIHQLVMDKMSKIGDRRTEKRSKSPISPIMKEVCEPKSPQNTVPSHKQYVDRNNSVPQETAKKMSAEINQNEQIEIKTKVNLIESKSSNKSKYPNYSETFSLPDIPQSVIKENIENIRNFEITNFSNNQNTKVKKPSDDGGFDFPRSSYPSGIVPGFRQLSLNDFSGKLVHHVESLRNCSPNNDSPRSASNITPRSLCTSDPNLMTPDHSAKKNKGKECDRRKSIIKKVSDLFSRRRDSPNMSSSISPSEESKHKLFHHGRKMTNKSVSCFNLEQTDLLDPPVYEHDSGEEIPPPIPPLPAAYLPGPSTSGNLNGNMLSMMPMPTSSKLQKAYMRRRCNSLNELQNKINETEKCIDEVKKMQARNWRKVAATAEDEEVLSNNYNILEKYLDNLRKQHTMTVLQDRELKLDLQYNLLRNRLRDIIHSGKGSPLCDIEEKSIIDEMLQIITERQVINTQLQNSPAY